jgi:hypothetical protein
MKYIKILENEIFDVWKSETNDNYIFTSLPGGNGWENFNIILRDDEIHLFKSDRAHFIDQMNFLIKNRNKKDMKLRRIEGNGKEKYRDDQEMIYIEYVMESALSVNEEENS